MKFAFYLGCVIPAKLPNYELSARKVLEKLGVELVDLEDFICCGFPFELFNHETWLKMSAYNLALAEKQGLNIVTLCNGCANSLAHANKLLKEDEEKRKEINEFLSKYGLEFKGKIEVKHFIRVLHEDVGLEKIKENIEKELSELKLATHTGCHVVRPSEYMDSFDNPIKPSKLDELVNITKAKNVNYLTKNLCCGNTSRGLNDKVSLELLRRKMKDLSKHEVDALVTICPACYIQYEMGQLELKTKFKEVYNIPVVHYPQILGLAMGMSAKEVGLDMNKIKPKKIIEAFK